MAFNINEVGARVGIGSDDNLQLGIYLPDITEAKGYELIAQIIHEKDQFDPSIEANEVSLAYIGGSYGLWQYDGRLGSLPVRGHMGQPGKYCYRYQLLRQGDVAVSWFTDPFGRYSAQGTLSAFHYPTLPAFQWQDSAFRVPLLNDLIVYELMVDEFNRDFDGVIEYLPYIKGLGINCIELMPVTNIREPFRWGYMPMSYFAIEERYGGVEKLKLLVDTCHREGIAVIHDAVYAHSSWDFPYNKVYKLSGEPYPMMGPFAGDTFGVGPDYNKEFAREYFAQVNDYFVDALHVDGFRYDYVPGFYDGATGNGYAKLVYDTYNKSKRIPRFFDGSISRIIQAAEYLDRPREVLRETFSSSSKRWWLMLKAEEMVQTVDTPGYVSQGFVDDILLIDTSSLNWLEKHPSTNPDEQFPTAPLQFIESHDRSRLMYRMTTAFFKSINRFEQFEQWREGGLDLLSDDDRNEIADRFDEWQQRWFKLQPFAIALMTAAGVPLIWQGQEFGEYYGLPDSGNLRVLAARPLHWDLFYEPGGRALVRLYRTLASLRHAHPALRSRKHVYYQQESRLNQGLVAYRRDPEGAGSKVMVLINFGSNGNASLQIPFPAGQWTEQLNSFEPSQTPEILNLNSDSVITINVPSYYGKIFVSNLPSG